MDYLNIALGKGRLADRTFALLEQIGINFEDDHTKSRKLIFLNKEEKIRIIFVKASDVAIYVEQGAADMGVVGKDTLLEAQASVYEIMDLGFGKCKFAVAAPKNFTIKSDRKLKVATKYPNVSKKFFRKKGNPIEIIKLNGSVELAPIIGLSDVIVDIVETGTTLKENGLEVIEDICSVSARLIVNKASFKTKTNKVHQIIRGLKECIE
ncbi:ATP phosphoribosyltransferase [Marinisporobacter balticus]|uniref:ATP phosphoribosyltransferase n=1 Tax=Marinisporobacter balticus TaxID=2018667 RepID=A0A4R2L609_9FIRM|nr:ATP phosphoribosyltransferase [Marinisporobacter balticus]TCO79376.1 ATP phosphoribosyltransferase catalytic subunit [Marinisporobacter balticus]